MSMVKSMKIKAKAVRLTIVLLAGVAALGTIGCGIGSEFVSTSIAGPALSGRVMGGRQPISGSTVNVWQVGNTGYGSAATLLATTTSDTNGNFGFASGAYTCPSTGINQLYITASGGNPGNSTGNVNPAILLMYALGSCTSAQAATGLNVNEVSTVASVFSLSGFINPATFGSSGTTGTTAGSTYTQDAVGTSSTNTTGLNNAVTTVGTLVTPAGITPGTTAGATVDYQKINTLGNILANCVNSDPTNGDTICSSLFTNVGTNSLTGAVAATNTFEAAYYMNTNPTDTVSGTSKLSTVFAAVPNRAPYSPALGSTAPSDWTIGVNYAVSGLSGGNRIAIDANGDAWVTGTGQVSEITPAGAVTSITNTGTTTPVTFSTPYGIAVDRHSNVIFTDPGNNDVFVFTTAGSLVETMPGTTGGALPYGIALGFGNKLWVSASPAPAATSTTGGVILSAAYSATNNPPFTVSTSTLTAGFTAHTGYGFGASSSSLIIDGKDTDLFIPLRYYNASGSGATATVGAIQVVSPVSGGTVGPISYSGTNTAAFFPTGVVFDADTSGTTQNTGNLWFTNTAYGTIGSTTYGSATTSSFLSKVPVTTTGNATTADSLPASTSVTTCSGGGLNGATFLATDGNNNIWVVNSGGNSVSEFANACSGTTGAISPATTGFVHSMSSPNDIAIDASGNVWVVNGGAANVTEIVGAAGPTIVPLVLNTGPSTTSGDFWGTKP